MSYDSCLVFVLVKNAKLLISYFPCNSLRKQLDSISKDSKRDCIHNRVRWKAINTPSASLDVVYLLSSCFDRRTKLNSNIYIYKSV